MSKRKPHDIKFKFKAIECVKKTTKEAANNKLFNIVLYFNGKRVLVVVCSHLKFFSSKECPNRLVHVVLVNDAFHFKIAQQSTM